MNYPFWDIGLGYGILMAAIAIVHVFISHFAIGGGLYLVVTERVARRSGDVARLMFVRKLSKFFILVTLVSGTLTGVGIWFVIGLLNPAATEALIHNFIWGWAIEWTFFAVEIAAAVLYYYGWERMSASKHLFIGWIYFIFAWLSLFIINGIITFMLTPGTWLQTGRFWDGFFNPTFWPSLILRTGICIMLAGLYSLLPSCHLDPPDLKRSVVRYSAAWGIVGLIIAAPSFYWYWKAIPAQITSAALSSLPTPILALRISVWFAAGIGVLLLVLAILIPRRLSIAAALFIMLLGLGFFGSFEWFRESVRKPYVIENYMYGNSLELARVSEFRSEGLLSHINYRSGDDGADLFRHACRSCHTIRGYKGLEAAFAGTDRVFISSIVKQTNLLKGSMPPFVGTSAEADLIAGHISAQLTRQSLSEITGLRGVELGKKVYDLRCGKCHARGSASDKAKSFKGMSREEINNVLDSAADLGAGMPAFTADATDRAACISYLETQGTGGGI